MPATLAYLYTNNTEVCDLLSAVGVKWRLDNDQDSALQASETAILTKALSYGTGRCNLYLLQRYTAVNLADDWNVQSWATIFAAVKVCRTRGNPVPKSLMEFAEEALEELMMVKDGDINLSITEAITDLPAYSNGVLDDRYRVRKWRIQRALSDVTPGGPRQDLSFEAEIIGPMEQ